MKSKRLTQAHFHFVGIGGIGMCGLAELLFNMGATITGSDAKANDQTKRLQEMGIEVAIGHSAENISSRELDVIVYSTAIPKSNVELVEGRAQKIPMMQRAEALAEMMLLKRGLAIAGTHGKTTTTSLTASVFLEAQFKPTIVVGGRLDVIKSTAVLGEGEWLIAEADESDGSFARLSPEVVVITNIDSDHLDHYQSFAAIKTAFHEFASRIPFYGVLIACGDDPVVREVFSEFPKKIWYYGFSEDNDYVLSGAAGDYQVSFQGKALGPMKVPVPGRHNALNALASVAAGMHAGIDYKAAASGIEGFKGVDRRFQHKGEIAGVEFYDDYGHHPTEVSAVMQAFREKYPDKKINLLFQPHRYSRSRNCWQDFVNCLQEVDRLFLLDIYPAGEAPIEGISSTELCKQVGESCQHTSDETEVLKNIVSSLQSGEVFVTMGAGDVWKWNDKVMQAFGAHSND